MEVEPSQQSRLLKNTDIQRMLLLAYSQIGEPDGLYGACSSHATDEVTRIHLYEHEKEWNKSLSKRWSETQYSKIVMDSFMT